MFCDINNYKINYVVEGDGKEVLLLHGWGANLNCFSQTINLLKQKYKVYAIDLPGFGESADLDKSFSVDDYVDIVSAFIVNVIKTKSIILVGHSYGGRIIIKLNSKDYLPFEIEKNVLIDAAGIKDNKDIKTKLKIAGFKSLKKLVYAMPIAEDKKQEIELSMKKKFGSSDYSAAPKVLQDTLVRSVNEDLSPYIKNMRETLLIWGDKDTATPLWMAKKMEQGIKNVGLVVLSGGHFSYLDDPYTYASVIKSYFKL